jgi:hypothetical protein
MAITYDIGGTKVAVDQPLDEDGLNELASHLHAAGAPEKGTDEGFFGEALKSAKSGFGALGAGLANIGNYSMANEMAEAGAPAEAIDMKPAHEAISQWYNKIAADNKAAVPSFTDIHGWHDFANYAAKALGGASPYVIGAMLGGLPGAVATGAIQTGQEEDARPGSTPASVATAGALGGATAAIPIPLLRGGITGNILSRLAQSASKGALGGAEMGAASGLGANVPQAVASGNWSDAVPSPEQVIDSALSGAIGVGALHGVKGFMPGAKPDPTQAGADYRLAQRLSDQAEQNDLNVKDVKYDSGSGAKKAADQVHSRLATDIKEVWKHIAPTIGEAENIDDVYANSKVSGIMRSALNKVKDRVGPEDLAYLEDAVGHTVEGQHLVDLVRQSNSLTDLFNGGFKGWRLPLHRSPQPAGPLRARERVSDSHRTLDPRRHQAA